jgi:hypothetical protein
VFARQRDKKFLRVLGFGEYVYWTVTFLWGALSDERTGLSFLHATGLASVVFLGSESLETRDHILLSQI